MPPSSPYYRSTDIYGSQAAADRKEEMNDLEPFWIFENEEEENYAIERHIPCYPMSRESSHLRATEKIKITGSLQNGFWAGQTGGFSWFYWRESFWLL